MHAGVTARKQGISLPGLVSAAGLKSAGFMWGVKDAGEKDFIISAFFAARLLTLIVDTVG